MPVYPNPLPREAEFRVNTTVPGDQYGSTVTTLADGGFVVAWAGSRAAGSAEYDIFIQRYSAAGIPVNGEIQANTVAAGGSATGFEHGPAVTAFADGGFIVAWLGPGTESPNIFAHRYASDGTPLGEFQINTSSGFHDTPVITALANGGFVAAWVGPGTNGVEIRARRYAADGAAAGDEFVVNTTQAGEQKAPAVTALAGGGFVVAWSGPGADGPDIFAQRYAADGTAAGPELRVNTGIAGDQLRPTVSALKDGGFVVAWVGNPVAGADNYDVLAQRYSADGSPNGGEFRVNTAAKADINGSLDIADLPDGGFLVSWGGIGVGAGDVYGQRFLANGAAAGAEFRINAKTDGYQYGPAVTASGPDGFVVSWSDKTQAGADLITEVYAQRFTVPAPVSGVTVAASPEAQAEGNAGTTAYTFTVRLDTAVGTAQSVQWQVLGVGANPAAATDFAGGVLPSGTLSFAAGETSKAFTVLVAGDAIAEWTETFAVQLSNPSAGIGLANGTAVAAIVDDEAVLVRGTESDDAFTGRSGVFAYEGQFGHDVLDLGGFGFRGAAVTAQADGSVLLTRGFDVHLMRGVEEVRFLDGRLAFAPYDPLAKVARLYEAALDRLPDQGGLNFWIGAARSGESVSGLAAGFVESPEFRSRFGDMADAGAFVDRLYLNVLDRPGDAGGRRFWVGALGDGAARADVLVAFADSDENKAGTAALVQSGVWDRSEAAAEVARLYGTAFGRLADAPGLVAWKEALEGGDATLFQVAEGFLASQEFGAVYGAMDSRGFVEALYRNALGRAADQPGLDHWIGQLDGGVARAAVVLAFSESPE
ncbi:MAG: DUF4214 domain-containing protein, partial [Acetobacteraceae bacterium]|nr:DUF4214 domain-containing protein [Acetobacteraceae bacterium]